MPNRILKETICTSETLDALSTEAEVFFYRLLVRCDDFGRMDARPSILRAACFPLKLDRVTDKQVTAWLGELSDNKLLWVYIVDGRSYLQVTTWNTHQQKRAKYSKYPQPPSEQPQVLSPDSTCNQLLADDSNREQLPDIVPENREARDEKRETRSESSALAAPPTLKPVSATSTATFRATATQATASFEKSVEIQAHLEPAIGPPRNLLFDAIAEVTASNPQLLGSRIAKLANELRKLDATPEQVQQVARWYKANDWRGQKGEKLTFEILKEVWDLGVRNTRLTPAYAGAVGRKNGLRPQVPDSTEEQRETAREEARKRIAERAERRAMEAIEHGGGK